jgi:RNA polymerase sigma factor (sigma-70 family)
MSTAATANTELPWPGMPSPGHSEGEDSSCTGEVPVAACAPALDDAQLVCLVERVCDQHEPSLVRLYEATSGRVYGLVLRIVRLGALAEEVVEDVFWQVWREAPRFDAERGRVLAWLLTIARSRAIDALRRTERMRAAEVVVEDDDTLEALASDRERSDDPFDLVGASQHHAQLHALLASLEPLPRQLISLAFMRGCTHEEIAEQTGLALGTVKSHIRRTLVLLRQQLANPTLSLEQP